MIVRKSSGKKSISVKATHDSTQFKVLGVTCTVPEIETELETVKEGREYRVKVRLAKDYKKPLLKGSITIATDDKDQSSIEVRVFGRSIDSLPKQKPSGAHKPRRGPRKAQNVQQKPDSDNTAAKQ